MPAAWSSPNSSWMLLLSADMNSRMFCAVSELQFLVAFRDNLCYWLMRVKKALTGNGTSGISPDKNYVRILKYMSCPALRTDWELTSCPLGLMLDCSKIVLDVSRVDSYWETLYWVSISWFSACTTFCASSDQLGSILDFRPVRKFLYICSNADYLLI